MGRGILTAQEHELMGSSIEDEYKSQPYKPECVIDNKLTVEECNQERRKRRTIPDLGQYFGRRGFADISLEELDLDPNSISYGHTIIDPQFVRWTNPLESCEKTTFPYQRE